VLALYVAAKGNTAIKARISRIPNSFEPETQADAGQG
jgi:hypothetical protein